MASHQATKVRRSDGIRRPSEENSSTLCLALFSSAARRVAALRQKICGLRWSHTPCFDSTVKREKTLYTGTHIASLCCACHLTFCHCSYELQVAASAQRARLGRNLMLQLESIGRGCAMTKVMLTMQKGMICGMMIKTGCLGSSDIQETQRRPSSMNASGV